MKNGVGLLLPCIVMFDTLIHLYLFAFSPEIHML